MLVLLCNDRTMNQPTTVAAANPIPAAFHQIIGSVDANPKCFKWLWGEDGILIIANLC